MDIETMVTEIDQEIAALDTRRQALLTAREALTTLAGDAATTTTTKKPAAAAVRQPRPSSAPATEGDGTRALVLRQVASKPRSWTSAQLAETLDLDKSTVLYHLRGLVEAGQVKVEGVSRATRYLPA